MTVVIDDGSTDGSYDAIRSCITQEVDVDTPPDSIFGDEELEISGGIIGEMMPLYIIRSPHGSGPSAARNRGLKFGWRVANLFGILDADDEYLAGKISKSVAKWKEDPGRIGMVYSDVLIRNVKTGTFMHEFREPFHRDVLERENIISNAPLLNRMALEEVGMYDEELRTCEDWDLWLRITERYVAVHIPEPLQIYSVTGFNATDVVNKERWQKDWRRVQEKLRGRHGK